MNFLNKLFGSDKKKESPKPKAAIKLENLEAKLIQRKQTLFLDLNSSCKPIISEINSNLNELKSQLREIESIPISLEEGNPQLRKVVITSKNNFLRSMNNIINSIQPKEFFSFDEISTYASNSFKLLEKEISTYGRNIAYTGALLKQEVKETGQIVQRIHSLLLQLHKKVSESNEEKINETISLLHYLQSLKKEISSHQSNLTSQITQISSQKEQLKSLEQKQLEISQSQKLKDLNALKQKLSEIENKQTSLKNQLTNLISPVEKQLNRFYSIVSAGQFVLTKDEQQILKNYLNNPLNALKSDPDLQQLKSFLISAKSLIEQGAISVKENEKEKRLQAIDYLLNYNLTDFHTALISIEKSLEEIKKEISLSTIEFEINQLDYAIEETKRNIQETENLIANIKQKKAELEAQLNECLSKVRKFTNEILNFDVV